MWSRDDTNSTRRHEWIRTGTKTSIWFDIWKLPIPKLARESAHRLYFHLIILEVNKKNINLNFSKLRGLKLRGLKLRDIIILNSNNDIRRLIFTIDFVNLLLKGGTSCYRVDSIDVTKIFLLLCMSTFICSTLLRYKFTFNDGNYKFHLIKISKAEHHKESPMFKIMAIFRFLVVYLSGVSPLLELSQHFRRQGPRRPHATILHLQFC